MSTKSNETDSVGLLQLVSFELNSEEFGIDILVVQEIIKMLPLTKVPNSPSYVDGVVNIRGRIIPVIDLRSKLGIQRIEHNNSTRIIIVEVDGKTIGFIVDAVTEVLRIPSNITEPPPALISGLQSEYIKAVGKLEERLLILIDIERVLTDSEKQELNHVVTENNN